MRASALWHPMRMGRREMAHEAACICGLGLAVLWLVVARVGEAGGPGIWVSCQHCIHPPAVSVGQYHLDIGGVLRGA